MLLIHNFEQIPITRMRVFCSFCVSVLFWRACSSSLLNLYPVHRQHTQINRGFVWFFGYFYWLHFYIGGYNANSTCFFVPFSLVRRLDSIIGKWRDSYGINFFFISPHFNPLQPTLYEKLERPNRKITAHTNAHTYACTHEHTFTVATKFLEGQTLAHRK